MGRVVLARRNGAEEGLNDGHDEGGGHALAADVAYAEEEFAVAHEGIVKVAPDGFGGDEPSLDADIGATQKGGFLGRQQGLLYVGGNAELAGNAILLHGALPELLFAAGEGANEEEQDAEGEQGEQQKAQAKLVEGSIYFIIVADDGHLPVGLSAHIGVEECEFVVGLAVIVLDDAHGASAVPLPADGAVVDEGGHLLHALLLLRGLRACQELSMLCEEEDKGGGIEVPVVECVAQVAGVDVDAIDGYGVARLVVDGHGVGDDLLVEVVVVVRAHPAVLLALAYVVVEAVACVVKLLSGQFQAEDAAVGAQCVRLEEFVASAVIAWAEGDAAALEVGSVLECPGHDAGQRVGIREVALHLLDVALDGALRVLNKSLGDDGLERQLQLGTPFQFVLQQPVGEDILHCGEQLDEQGGDDDYQQRAPLGQEDEESARLAHVRTMLSNGELCPTKLRFF